MECRGCGRQIPDDTELCLICGTRQTPFVLNMIEAREERRERRSAKTVRFVIPATIVAALILFSVLVTPLFAGGSEAAKLAEIERSFEARDKEAFIIQASQFYSRYAESDNMETVLRYASQLGLKLAAPGVEDIVARARAEETASPQAVSYDIPASEVQKRALVVTRLSWSALKQDGSVKCGISWMNKTDKTVTSAVFTMEIRDVAGNTIKCEKRGETTAAAKTVGAFAPSRNNQIYSDTWIGLWFNKDVASVALTGVEFGFSDGSRMQLDAEQSAAAMADNE